MEDPLRHSMNSDNGETATVFSTDVPQSRAGLPALSSFCEIPTAHQFTTAAALVASTAQVVEENSSRPSIESERSIRRSRKADTESRREDIRKKPRVGGQNTTNPLSRSEGSSFLPPLVDGNVSRTAFISASRIKSLKNVKSKSICHHLIQRSTFGSRHVRYGCVARPSLNWKPTSWIQFDDVDAQRLRLSSSKGNCLMAWDKLGVLLAVSSDSVIRVYDWDMVRAADVRGRNLRAKGQSGGAFAIEPILRFPVRAYANHNRSCQVTVLTWNPYQSDELIVGTRDGDVFVYDLGTELVCGVPSHRQLWNAIDRISNHQSVSSIALVHDGRLMIVGFESSVFCINVKDHRIVWEWKTFRVGCIEHIPGTRMVLIGHSSGFMSILDYSKHQNKGLSCSASPTVLRTWLSHAGCGPTPQGPDMGIRHLQLGSNDETFRDVKARTPIQLLPVTWVTCCGWVLQSLIDLTSPVPPRTTILYATAPVKIENANGDAVSQPTAIAEWSLPVDSHVAAAGASSFLVWEAVPEVRRILPQSDYRVLDCKPRILRDWSNPRLLVLANFSNSASIQSIKLSKRRNHPVVLSVHPNQDWVVVATNVGIYTLTTRGCKT